jgi:hypothetical protein
MVYLTQLERQICAHTGVSEAAFAAQKGKKLRIDLVEIAAQRNRGAAERITRRTSVAMRER